MSFGTVIVALFAIAAIAWLRAQKNRNSALDAPTSREPELEREVQELRNRIAVLERIAIEERGGDRLAREIESLRD
jgi:type II secretory pathway component PulJ